MKKLYFIPALIFLLTSCKKDPSTKLQQGMVEGIVRDATTYQTVPNSTVFLLQGEATGSLFGCCPTTVIAQTLADSLGAFSFKFNFESGYFYACKGATELYFDESMEYNVDFFVMEGNNVEVLLNPKAWLNIHFKNVDPNSDSDYFNINGTEGGPYNGSDIDSFVVMIVYGNKEFNLSWFVGEEGNTVNFQNNIYCPSFDTTYYEILY